jgi:uncharacterized protein (DUF1778 family)
MTNKHQAPVRLALPLMRDRLAKRESVRVRVSEKEKRALRTRAQTLGCSITELVLGLVLEHGDKVVVVDR